MYKLEVVAGQVNIRNSPFADPAFANWVGSMSKGEVFNAVRLVKGTPYEGNDNWYADDGGSGARFIAAAEVRPLPLSKYNNLSDKIILKSTVAARGEGLVIGILDTGLDKDHPSMRAACLSDDDFLTQVHDSAIKNNHGTKVAGIIAGNAEAVTGFAIDSKIRCYRTNDNEGNTDDRAVVNALNHIISNNIQVDILNLSLDITNAVKDEVQAAVTTLAGSGVIIVAAGFSQLFGDVSNLAGLEGIFPIGIIEENDFDTVKNNGINPAWSCAFANSGITTMGFANSDDPHPVFKSSSAYTAVATGIIAKFLSSNSVPPAGRVDAVKNFLSGNAFDIKTETGIQAFKPYKNEKN